MRSNLAWRQRNCKRVDAYRRKHPHDEELSTVCLEQY